VDEQVVRGFHVAAGSTPEPYRASPVDLSKLSDVELMERLRDGEQEALSHLFDRYHRLVLNIASKLIRDRAEAEDLMQEVFFDVYRVVDRFDPAKGTAKSWIVQFTYHKGLNRRKHLALRDAFADQQIREFDPQEAVYYPHGSNGHSSDDVLAIVQQGLATLNLKQRETVELVCLEGFLLREIADRTKEPLGNVRHHYYRGIEKLRDFTKRNLHPVEKGVPAVRGSEK
jgi:RNA polymerase sigma-70 factor (ECF subfamily)